MRNKNELFAAIMEKPENDELRLEFAAAVRSEDPEWADYILGTSVAVRSGRTEGHHSYSSRPRPSQRLEKKLWAPFTEFGVQGELERGFPSTIRVHRDVFLERGDVILSLAPILMVRLHADGDSGRATNESWIPYLHALSRSPVLAKIHKLGISGKVSVDAFIDFTRSEFLERLVLCSLSVDKQNSEEHEKFWNARLESGVFRRMADWGAFEEERGSMHAKRRISAPREYGDVERQEQGHDAAITFYDPMNEASRELERKYGYIPALHAGNWGASVLDVLQGRKPDFPAGAGTTEAMYSVPPPDDHH